VGENFRLAKEIAQIAGRQQGNIARRQLRRLGLDDAWIHRAVRAGYLFRVHHGVYSVGRPPTTPLERAAAAVLACGDRAALCFGSALTLWGVWRRWDELLEVVVAGDRRPSGIRSHRMTGLLRRDIVVEQGITVTSPALTLLHCAPRMRPKSRTRAVNDWRRTEIMTVEELADVVARFPLQPGAPLLKPHAETTQNPTRSGFEDDFLPFCRQYNLPTPQINILLHGHEVDAYFKEAKLVAELDGWPFHNDRQAFEHDRERDATMLLHGIATIRITRRRLRSHPAREAARLRAIIESRLRA
jgi:hypothetical protein